MGNWNQYHKLVGERPNSLVVSVLEKYIQRQRRRAALDLGAGNLRDSKYLKRMGFTRVVAVDSSEESLAFSTEGVELCIQPIETYEAEADAFDFVISCNTLFFLPKTSVEEVFENVLHGLHSGGVFACNVLGPEDDWVSQGAPVSSFQESDIVRLYGNFEVINANPVHFDQLSSTPGRPSKHWHQWCLVLRKP